MTQPTKEEVRDLLRQAVVTDSPESAAFADWPLHKMLMAVYKDCGPDSVTVLLEQFNLRYEELADNARELEHRHFGHVAKLLREAAKGARSQVDDIIEDAPDYIQRLGPEAVESHKQCQLVNWLTQRLKVTGISWNTTVRDYGLEEWIPIKAQDFTMDTDNRVRLIPASNGADSGQ